MTPDQAGAVAREIRQVGRQAATNTGGSWPGKVVGAAVNGYYRVEDAAGRVHRVSSTTLPGKLAQGRTITVADNADGTRSVIANGGVEF